LSAILCIERPFWCLLALLLLLLLRLFLVAFLCNTTHRYGWQPENETPKHRRYFEAFGSI